MGNALAFRIALRYLFSKKSTNAINIITAVAMVGMGVGAMALLLVLSVFNGFEGLVLSLYNQFTPDLLITPKQGKVFTLSEKQLHALRQHSDIMAIATVLEEKALLKYQDREYIASVRGIDDNYLKVNAIDAALAEGNFILNDGSLNYMVLGAGVRAALGVTIADGLNAISVFLPRRGSQAGSLLPTDAFSRRFIHPSGIISIQQEYDYEYVFVPIDFLREALKYENEISALELKLKPEADINKVKKDIAVLLGDTFKMKDRYEQDETLFKVMNTERVVAYGIFAFVILIISFNITGALSMIAIDKSKDIAVLKTLGATPLFIKMVFLWLGALITFVGAAGGIVAASIIGAIQYYFEVIKMNTATMVVDAYPVVFTPESFLMVLCLTLSLGFMASLIPAMRASCALATIKGR